jgi:hypothetical protein
MHSLGSLQNPLFAFSVSSVDRQILKEFFLSPDYAD